MLRLVEVQAQALQLQQAFDALIDSLEVEDVGAGKVAAGAVHLIVAECAIVHRLDLTCDRGDHAVCLFGHGSGVDAKKTRQQVGRVSHAAADAVNQSQLIANDSAEPVGETRAGTEDVVENHQGLEIGMMAGNSQMAKHQVDLLPGAVDSAHPRLYQFGHAGERARRLTPGEPGAELAVDQVSQRSGVEISSGHEKRSVGSEVAAVMRDHIAARQQPDITQAAPRISAQRVAPIDEPPEDQVNLAGRILPVALKLCQNALLGPIDGALGKDGLSNQVSQQLTRQGKVLDADSQRDAGGVDVHRPAHVLDRRGQLGGRAILGSFVQQPARQVRDSGFVLAEKAGIDMQFQGDNTRTRPAFVDNRASRS